MIDDQAWNGVRGQVRYRAHDQVRIQVWSRVWRLSQVWDEVLVQVYNQVSTQLER